MRVFAPSHLKHKLTRNHGITIKFSCGICIELKLNNWIGAVATATATAAIAATATIAPTTAMHSQRYNAAMRSAEHRHP